MQLQGKTGVKLAHPDTAMDDVNTTSAGSVCRINNDIGFKY
jgi:hypothetical protein